MSNQRGIYTYCVIQTDQRKQFGKIRMGGKESIVYTIPYKDTAMVVSKGPSEIVTNKENMLNHQQVISTAMKTFTPIPMSFGTVFQSEEDVRKLLKFLYEQLQQEFQKIRNKFEVGLKLFGKREWLEKQANNDPQIKKWKDITDNKSVDAAYYDRIKLGELAQKLFMFLQQQIEQEIYQPLSDMAEEAKMNDVVGERMLLNAAFLIDRNKEAAFDEKVNQIFQRWNDKMEFKYTGPWPVYNFIDIQLTSEGKG